VSSGWLVDERRSVQDPELQDIQHALDTPPGMRAARLPTLTLAVRIGELIVHDTHKWFGSANLRLDAIVSHGGGDGKNAQSYYMPRTVRFSGVVDGSSLLATDTRLLIFHGRARHFIKISLLLSRETSDSDDLAHLLTDGLGGAELTGAATSLVALTPFAPQAAAVRTALKAASAVGDYAYRVLRTVSEHAIGLYHGSFLQLADDFGLDPGRHPKRGLHQQQDFSFWFEILDETASK